MSLSMYRNGSSASMRAACPRIPSQVFTATRHVLPVHRLGSRPLYSITRRATEGDAGTSAAAVAPEGGDLGKKIIDATCTYCKFHEGGFTSNTGELSGKRSSMLLDAAKGVIAPSVVMHADGVIYHQDRHGIDEYLWSLKEERAANYLKHLATLTVAFNPEDRVSFILMRQETENRNEWLGHPATRRSSAGLRVDELQFDTDGKIREICSRRQLTHEELQQIHKKGHEWHQPDFQIERLKALNSSPGHPSPTEHENMEKAVNTWLKCWNTADVPGVDDILADDITAYDVYGFWSKEARMYQRYTTKQECKKAMQAATNTFDVRDRVIGYAASDTNAVAFCHWISDVRRKSTREMFQVDSIDVYLFNSRCKIQQVLEFRKPTGKERREEVNTLPEIS